jgi:copper chaperone NosL
MRPRRSLRVASLVLALSCAPGVPDAILYGVDACAYCRMQISDQRFGAVLVTAKGRTVKFDSIDCLIAYFHRASAEREGGGATVWVSDFRNPGTLLRADTARFINLGPGRTPMGRERGWAAVATARDAAALGVIDISEIKRWTDL